MSAKNKITNYGSEIKPFSQQRKLNLKSEIIIVSDSESESSVHSEVFAVTLRRDKTPQKRLNLSLTEDKNDFEIVTKRTHFSTQASLQILTQNKHVEEPDYGDFEDEFNSSSETIKIDSIHLLNDKSKPSMSSSNHNDVRNKIHTEVRSLKKKILFKDALSDEQTKNSFSGQADKSSNNLLGTNNGLKNLLTPSTSSKDFSGTYLNKNSFSFETIKTEQLSNSECFSNQDNEPKKNLLETENLLENILTPSTSCRGCSDISDKVGTEMIEKNCVLKKEIKLEKSESFKTDNTNKLLTKNISRQSSSSSKICPPKEKSDFNNSFSLILSEDSIVKQPNFDRIEYMIDLVEKVTSNNHLVTLLSEKEVGFLNIFIDVDSDAQFCIFKLFTYIQKWYNMNKFCQKINLKHLSEEEVIDLCTELETKGFVNTDYTSLEPIKNLLDCMHVPDLKALCTKFRVKKIGEKDKLKAGLLKVCQTQRTITPSVSMETILLKEIKTKLGLCVKMSKEAYDALYKCYILCTFTCSDYIDIEVYFNHKTFLRVNYPSYEVENYIPFNGPQFLRFYDAICLKRDFYKLFDAKPSKKLLNLPELTASCNEAFERLKSIDADSKPNQNVPQFLHRFSAEHQYISIVKNGAKKLYTSNPHAAKDKIEYLIHAYSTHKDVGKWFILLSDIYCFMKKYESAVKTICSSIVFNIEHGKFSEIELSEIHKKAKIIRDRKSAKISPIYYERLMDLGVHYSECEELPFIAIDAHTIRGNEPGRRRMYRLKNPDGSQLILPVEEVALRHYATTGFPSGLHCEGSFLRATFCLLFWDIIYHSDVPKTFLCEIQTAPLDMYIKDFYLNRKKAIDNRLEEIRNAWSEEELKEKLVTEWSKHHNVTSLVKIDSQIQDANHLCTMISCINRCTLVGILERFAKNYRETHSGLPDLFIWNNDLKTSKFVEVKGENDQLSLKQTLWLDYLRTIGADIELCHVHSLGSKRKQKLFPRSATNVTIKK